MARDIAVSVALVAFFILAMMVFIGFPLTILHCQTACASVCAAHGERSTVARYSWPWQPVECACWTKSDRHIVEVQ